MNYQSPHELRTVSHTKLCFAELSKFSVRETIQGPFDKIQGLLGKIQGLFKDLSKFVNFQRRFEGLMLFQGLFKASVIQGLAQNTFSRALRQLYVFTLSFDWFTGCDYSGFTTLN